MLKSSVFLMIVLYLNVFFISGCTSYTVKRSGYEKEQNSQDIKSTAEISIVKFSSFNSNAYEKIGEIKLRDNAFTAGCSESDAIRMLREEASYLGADIVNIIDERRPDMLNSCYSCQAEFFKTLNPNIKINSSSAFKEENIKDREGNDNFKIVAGVVIAITLGIITGRMLAERANE